MWCSISVNLHEFLDTSLGWGWFLTCCQFFESHWDCSFRRNVCSSESLLLCAKMKEVFSHQRHLKKILLLQWALFYVLLDFETYFYVTLCSSLRRKSTAIFFRAGNVRYFEIAFQHIIISVTERRWSCFCFKKTCDWLVICQNTCWPCCAKYVLNSRKYM